MSKLLVVATHRKWIADRLAEQENVPVRYDPGFDAPLLPSSVRTGWWMPTEHAARLLRAGLEISLSAPGPAWLTRVPHEYTGRSIWEGSVKDVRRCGISSGWCKPAEAKIEAVPADWWDDTAEFADALTAAGAPDSVRVQITPTRLNISAEYRCFILNKEVAAVSLYLRNGETYDPSWDSLPDFFIKDAAAFAAQICVQMETDQPVSYTLDVAMLESRRWIVLEGNPVWSSNPYEADPAGVVNAVMNGSTGPHGDFTWVPDPWIVQYAEKRALLKVSTPAWNIPE